MGQDRSMPAPNSSRPTPDEAPSRRCMACYRPAAALHVAQSIGGEREQEVSALVTEWHHPLRDTVDAQRIARQASGVGGADTLAAHRRRARRNVA